MILSLNGGSEEDIKRYNTSSLFHFKGFLNPLVMLVDYRVDDIDKGLVTVQQSVPPRENVAF
jgi:hypothetical protein